MTAQHGSDAVDRIAWIIADALFGGWTYDQETTFEDVERMNSEGWTVASASGVPGAWIGTEGLQLDPATLRRAYDLGAQRADQRAAGGRDGHD